MTPTDLATLAVGDFRLPLRARLLALLRLGVPMTVMQMAKALWATPSAVRRCLYRELVPDHLAIRSGTTGRTIGMGRHQVMLWAIAPEQLIPKATTWSP